jgi:predicted Rdx family selenoprotein
VRATEDLLKYQHLIEEIRLVMGEKGVFDVDVDGNLIYSKKAAGRHAKPGEVLQEFEKLLPPGTREYGT